jgi:hypothetical protein
MTVGAQLDGGYDVVRARPQDILLMTAAFVVPLQLVVAFVNRGALSDGGDLLDEALFHVGSDGTATDSGVLGPVLGILGSSLAHTLSAAAIAFTVAAWYAGGRPTPGDALRDVGRRAPSLLGAWLVVHLLEGLGLLAVGIGGVLVMALLLPTVPAIVLEDLGPIAGVRRGARLARPRFGYVLGVALLSGILAWVIGHALGLLPQLLGLALGPDIGWVFLGVGAIVADVVTISVTAATTVLVYLDLRIRQEGLDLAWAAARELPT